MFEGNKRSNELSLTYVSANSSIQASKTKNAKNYGAIEENDQNGNTRKTTKSLVQKSPEPRFPTMDTITSNRYRKPENIVDNIDNSQQISPQFNNHGLKDVHFNVILFEHGLKALAILSLSISLIVTVTFLGRQITVKTHQADLIWQWLGFVKAGMSLFVTIIAVCYKVMLYKNKHYVEDVKPENLTFFYTFVIFSFALSWIYFLIEELRNYEYWGSCIKTADLVLPISQMLFIMVVVMSISDLMSYQIRTCVPMKFYVVYKTSAIMVFVNCINCLIFDLFRVESLYIQNYLSNGSYDIYCYHKKFTGGFIDLMNFWGPFLQYFVIIFFVSSIAILIKPLQQFSKIELRTSEDTRPLLTSFNADESVSMEQSPQYSISSLITALILCVLPIISILLDTMTPYAKDHWIKHIIFRVLPLFVYIFNSGFSLYFLKLLHNNFPMDRKRDNSITDSIILWLSLFGQLTKCFKIIINSSQFLAQNNPCNGTSVPDPDSGNCTTMHIICIIMYGCAILESLLQAMVLDFINNVRTEYLLRKDVFWRMSYPAVSLIASNIGLFVLSWYMLSGSSSFVSFPDPFNQILWDLISTISDMFTLLFTSYCAVFLLRFLSKLRCVNN